MESFYMERRTGMNELMNITEQTPIEIALGVDADGMTTAKQLYNFLELNPAHYKRWTTQNIVRNPYGEENIDYFPFTINGEWGGRATTDYKITANFAKKLSMMTSSPKGEIAREYFLSCEKVIKENIAALKKENQKLKLLTVSKSQKFSAMYPKFDLLTKSLHISMKELYKKIFDIMQSERGIDLTSKTLQYCYEHNLSDCYTMTVIQEDPQLFLCMYEVVDSMIADLN